MPEGWRCRNVGAGQLVNPPPLLGQKRDTALPLPSCQLARQPLLKRQTDQRGRVRLLLVDGEQRMGKSHHPRPRSFGVDVDRTAG